MKCKDCVFSEPWLAGSAYIYHGQSDRPDYCGRDTDEWRVASPDNEACAKFKRLPDSAKCLDCGRSFAPGKIHQRLCPDCRAKVRCLPTYELRRR
jgi:hypothetical protein